MRRIVLLIALILIGTQFYYAQNWRKVVETTFSPLNDVYFLNDDIGWVIGSSGEYAKSVDGGMTWGRPLNPIPIEKSLNSEYFVDEINGFIGADDGYFLITTDGGENWIADSIEIAIGDVEALYFSDVSTGCT